MVVIENEMVYITLWIEIQWYHSLHNKLGMVVIGHYIEDNRITLKLMISIYRDGFSLLFFNGR